MWTWRRHELHAAVMLAASVWGKPKQLVDAPLRFFGTHRLGTHLHHPLAGPPPRSASHRTGIGGLAAAGGLVWWLWRTFIKTKWKEEVEVESEMSAVE
jgi:hypothetical protein